MNRAKAAKATSIDLDRMKWPKRRTEGDCALEVEVEAGTGAGAEVDAEVEFEGAR